MSTCLLCGEYTPDSDMWDHPRLMHPDRTDDGLECWPDGEPVIHDLTLKPADFSEEALP